MTSSAFGCMVFDSIIATRFLTDGLPTMLNMIGHGDHVPTDRVIDGCDQSAFVTGRQEHSNRDYFSMFFDRLHVGMRYKNSRS